MMIVENSNHVRITCVHLLEGFWVALLPGERLGTARVYLTRTEAIEAAIARVAAAGVQETCEVLLPIPYM